MLSSIDKSIVGLILALLATFTDFGGDTTLAQVIEGVVVAFGVWAAPNKSTS